MVTDLGLVLQILTSFPCVNTAALVDGDRWVEQEAFYTSPDTCTDTIHRTVFITSP